MSMSTRIMGIKPTDERFAAMLNIINSCKAQNIKVPKEVNEFFNGEEPNKLGVSVDLMDLDCCLLINSSGRVGFSIDITKLPKDISIIQFTNCY